MVLSMYKIIFCLLVSIYSIASATDLSITPYLTSECNSLALVDDLVNTCNGKLVQIDQDIYIDGTHPLSIMRYYDGGHHYESSFGYGFGLSIPVLLHFFPYIDKSNVSVEQRMGCKISFSAMESVGKKKDKHLVGGVETDFLKSGYTNCCEGLMRGEPSVYASKVDCSDDHAILTLGDGTKRHYEYIGKGENNLILFHLVLEEMANGNRRHYSYSSQSPAWVKRIWTTNREDNLTFNWINISYSQVEGQAKIKASNGQYICYQEALMKGHAKQNNKEYKYKNWILEKVSGSHIPTSEYNVLTRAHYENSIFSLQNVRKPDGRYLEVEYDNKERVKKLIASGISLYSFNYQKDFTEVTDALGNTKSYDFSSGRVIKLTEKLKTQKFSWDERGQLTKHTIKNSSGAEVSKREYNYDSFGSITEARLTANITNPISSDTYVVKYAYLKDKPSLLLSECHNNQIAVDYDYLPNTNLLIRKFTFAEQTYVEREFYQYDNNGILICKMVDDGSAVDSSANLSNVTYRIITDLESQLNPDLPGMTLPKVIKESYHLANGPKQLLKMIERNYSHGDLLTEEKTYDANGQFRFSTYYKYNDRRELISETDTVGIETIYAYDNNGNKIYEERLQSGKKIHYQYDVANRLVGEFEEHSDGQVFNLKHSYDAMGNRISTTDCYGLVTTFRYDSLHREIANTDPLGRTEYKEYDVSGNVIKLTDRDGYTTKTKWNLHGKPLAIHYPDGTTKRFSYNINGQLIQEWEPDGTSTAYEVDYQGRPKIIRNYSADGQLQKTAQRLYKGPNLITEIDSLGNKTEYLYDGAGRKIAMVQGDKVTSYEYDALGRLYKTKIGDNVEITEYDNLDRVIEERTEDLSGKIYYKMQYAFDRQGNCNSEKTYSDADHFAETKTTYNSQNLPVLIVDALGNQTSIVYQHSNHLEKVTIDPLGRRKVEVFDQLSRLADVNIFSESGELLAQTKFTYDGRGNPIKQQEKRIFQNQSEDYIVNTTYDEMNRKIAITEQEARTTRYTYQNGKLYTITNPDGVILTHTYDALGCLQALISSDNTISFRYSYDLNDNLLVVEDLINSSVTQRSYDYLNRLVNEKQATGNQINFAYDSLDRVKEVAFFDTKLVYNYSPAYLLSAARYKVDQLLYTYSQQPNWQGKPVASTIPNGVNISYSWDQNERCSQIDSQNFSQNFDYDPLGNLIITTVHDPLGLHVSTFTYDGLNQLAQEVGSFTNLYTYDSLLNRRSKNERHCDIDSLNEVVDDTLNRYSYDLNGRRATKNDAQYIYDALGRLLTYQDSEHAITYKYDPFGRRIERKANEGTVQYLYQFDTEIAALKDGQMKEFRALHGKHSAFAIELDEVIYAPIRNHRGDICVLIDTAGIPISTYRYDAFGLFTHDGLVNSPWLFTGQRYESDTAFYHFDKREYDPSIGRWLTPDPLGFVDGPNLYAYVHNNPLIYVDPYGLWKEELKDLYDSSVRGGMDDITFGASSCLLGNYEAQNGWQKAGYYVVGPAASLLAGVYLGTTQIKFASYAYKGAKGVCNIVRGFAKTSKSAYSLKLAEKTPALQKVTDLVNQKLISKQHLNLDKLAKAGQEIYKGEISNAGRALQKHGVRQGSAFPNPNGNSKQVNLQAQDILENILTHPKSVRMHKNSNRLGEITDIRIPGGEGVRYSSDGRFIGFLEPN